MKRLLFVGIFLLVLGIILRKATQMGVLGLVLILTGVLFKTIYILAKVKNGEYQPGKEMLFLVVGLILFLTGLYLRNFDQTYIKPIYLIVSGLTLKVIFILRFIQIVRSNQKIV